MALAKLFGVKVLAEFSAAHHIRGYNGDCARPHGHNYKLEIEATAPRLNSIGLAIDFKDLKRMLKGLVEKFDHQDLNTIAPFTDINPTAETIAQFFFEDIERQIRSNPDLKDLVLRKVCVWENDRSAATYGIWEA